METSAEGQICVYISDTRGLGQEGRVETSLHLYNSPIMVYMDRADTVLQLYAARGSEFTCSTMSMVHSCRFAFSTVRGAHSGQGECVSDGK